MIIFLGHAHLRAVDLGNQGGSFYRDPQPYFQDCTGAPWLVSWNAGTGRPGQMQMPGVDDGQCGGGDQTERAWSLHLVCPFRASTMLRCELGYCQADLLQIP